MKTFILILLLFGVKSVSSQSDSLTRHFLTCIVERDADTSVIGYTKTIGYDYYSYLPLFELSKGRVWDLDTRRYVLRFSKKERHLILEQISQNRNSVWSDSLIRQSELILPGTSENYIQKNVSRHIWQFTAPIFIRNNTLALILVKHHFPGNKKGYEETALYRRYGEEWRRIAKIKRDEW